MKYQISPFRFSAAYLIGTRKLTYHIVHLLLIAIIGDDTPPPPDPDPPAPAAVNLIRQIRIMIDKLTILTHVLEGLALELAAKLES